MAGRGESVGIARRCRGEHDVLVFGVLNVTPDSFSDGGRYFHAEAAVAHGLALVRDGADVIDVGGESTRPRGATYGEGYATIDPDEECRRVVPVVRALVDAGVRVSIDTTKPEVAEAALEAGASIVNDTSGGASQRLLDAVAANDAELVLMHNRGRGEVSGAHVVYEDLVGDVVSELRVAAARAFARGVREERVWLDPGLGFAKTPSQSLALHVSIASIVAMGHPVLLGASRKAFLAAASVPSGSATPAPDQRLGATIASAIHGANAGVRGVRVHDVHPVAQALRVSSALASAKSPASPTWR